MAALLLRTEHFHCDFGCGMSASMIPEIKVEEASAPSATTDFENSVSVGSTDEVGNAVAGGNETGLYLPGDTSFQAITIRGLQRLGLALLFGAEFVGEMVANVLGLNESKFQYVIDGMSEEDWKVAREVQAQREKEEREQKDGKDVEGGAGGELTLEERMRRTQEGMLCMREG